MKGRSCCSTCLFTGGSVSGRRPLIFKHGGHLSYGGRSGTFAANARTLAMCRLLAATHSVHSERMCSSVSSACLQYGQQWEVIMPCWCARAAVHNPPARNFIFSLPAPHKFEIQSLTMNKEGALIGRAPRISTAVVTIATSFVRVMHVHGGHLWGQVIAQVG